MLLNKKKLKIMVEFSSNYNGRVYGSKIAKKLKMNQKTVSNMLNGLEKENILKFKKEGKNKYYSLNRHNLQIKEILKMIEISRKVDFLNKYNSLASLFGQLEKRSNGLLILFGSYANLCAGKGSDLDLFLIGTISSIRDLEETYDLKINIVKSTKKKFNPKEHLIKEIMGNHIILKGVEDFIELAW